jgi:SAM-dependent methyltransferase
MTPPLSESRANDDVRDFWDARAKENAAFYVDTSLDYAEPDMARFFETGLAVVEEALHQAPVKPVRYGRALEIGSGLGRICRALASEFDEVIGVDIAPSMIAQAETLNDDPKVRFVLGDGATLAGIEDASIDFLVTFTVLQHQPTTDAVATYLHEAGRVLRPGGVLSVQWNNMDPAALRRHVRKWKLLGPLRRLPAYQRVQTQPAFRGSTAPTALLRNACEEADLAVRGTKGEGTLFAWLWAEKLPASSG